MTSAIGIVMTDHIVAGRFEDHASLAACSVSRRHL